MYTHKFISLRGFEKKNLNVWVRLFGFIYSFPCIPLLNRGAGAVPLLTYSKVCTTTKIFLDFTVVLSFIVVLYMYYISHIQKCYLLPSCIWVQHHTHLLNLDSCAYLEIIKGCAKVTYRVEAVFKIVFLNP